MKKVAKFLAATSLLVLGFTAQPAHAGQFFYLWTASQGYQKIGPYLGHNTRPQFTAARVCEDQMSVVVTAQEQLDSDHPELAEPWAILGVEGLCTFSSSVKSSGLPQCDNGQDCMSGN